jgi:hypothetical protein
MLLLPEVMVALVVMLELVEQAVRTLPVLLAS